MKESDELNMRPEEDEAYERDVEDGQGDRSSLSRLLEWARLRRELDTTLIVVAYRLSTIRLADRVIFLENGRVAATGSHDELLATQPGYAAIIRAYEDRDREEVTEDV